LQLRIVRHVLTIFKTRAKMPSLKRKGGPLYNPYTKRRYSRARAARMIQRKFRSRRRTRMTRATPMTRMLMRSSRPKLVSMVNTMDIQVDTRTLQQVSLTTIPSGTGPTNREKNDILLSGWKIKLNIENIAANEHMFRWAIIQNKQGAVPTAGLTNFFAGRTSFETGLSFSNTKTGIEMMTLSINRQVYNVHKQGYYTLAGTTLNQGYRPTSISQNLWIKYGKKIRFDTATNPDPFIPWYFVWWYDTSRSLAASVPQTNRAKLSLDIVAAFHDVS